MDREEEGMKDEPQLLSFLDRFSDSSLNQFMLPADAIQEKLSNFGLTQNESKIFIFLGKYGAKSAIEITKMLKISRTETYRVINTLQNRGTVSSSIDHPVKFSALPINKALDILIRTEMENVRVLQNQKNDIVDIWNSLPSFAKQDNNVEEKMQILKGQNSIVSKVNNMIHGAQKSLLLLCSEKNFMRLYHSDLVEMLQNTLAQIKILTSCSENSVHIFEKMKGACIRKMPNEIQENFCMLIRDEKEVILFTRNDHRPSQEMMAIKTDSVALSYPMVLLFEQIWSTSKNLV
jgi:sugar-specific transcriptional regulator TrmB